MNRPVEFHWQTVSSQSPWIYQSQNPTKFFIRLQPNQKDTYTFKTGSSVQLTNDQLVNTIKTFASVVDSGDDGDSSTKPPLLVNGKLGSYYVSLSKDERSPTSTIKIEEPKGINLKTVYFSYNTFIILVIKVLQVLQNFIF